MGNKEMNKLVIEIKELEQIVAEAQAEIESIKDEIKADMDTQGKDEIMTGTFTIRWKETKSRRFNGKRFQADHKDLYEAYRDEQTTKRFTIN